MNAKEAADVARTHIINENHNLSTVRLDLEEVVPDPARRDWRVILSFTPPGGQQGQQGASTSRDYKKVIINDTNGSLVSMMDCTPCAPKCVCKIPAQDACTAEQHERQRTGTPLRWWHSPRSLFRAFVATPGAIAGWLTGGVMIVQAASGEPTIYSALVLLAYVVGMIAGLVIEVCWWRKQGS